MNIDKVTNDTRFFLKDYLEDNGISVPQSGLIQCINPDHDDSHASMQLNTKTEVPYLWCHGCHATYDIFAAASIIEDLPSSGIEWLENNVLELANRYGVYSGNALIYSNQDPNIALSKRAYNDAANLIANSPLSIDAALYIDEHNWSSVKDEFGLGCISTSDLTNALLAKGYTTEQLSSFGLIDHNLFNEDNLIFPIRDRDKKVVGFQARCFNKNSKYINSESISKYSPYKKSSSLYNIDKVDKLSGPLVITEGQTDCITAYMHGVRAISTNSSSISDEQINIIAKLDVPSIYICLDGDAPGISATLERFIPKLLAYAITPIPRVITIPDKLDLDEYLRKNTFQSLRDNYSLNISQYYLSHNLDKSRELLCEELISLYIKYTSPIAKAVIAHEIATTLELPESAIFARIEELNQLNQEKANKKKLELAESAVKDLTKHPENITQILTNTLSNIESLNQKDEKLSSQSFIDYLKDIKQEEEHRDDAHPGFILRNFTNIQKALRGDWTQTMIIIGGDENSGKSTLADAIIYDIISNPVNDAMAIIHLTDDSVKERIKKYICLADQEVNRGYLTYEAVAYPEFFTRNMSQDQRNEILNMRQKAYQRFYQLSLEERIILKDAKDSCDLDFGRALVARYRTKYPERKIIKLTDSINRAKLPFIIPDERIQTKEKSSFIKEEAVRFDITEIVISEFNRPDDKVPTKIVLPNMKRLAETRALEFDCQAGLLIYNDLHVRGQNATFIWRDQNGEARPRNIVNIGKNKISDWKGNLVYDFDQVRARFTQVDHDQANTDMLNEEFRLQKIRDDKQAYIKANSSKEGSSFNDITIADKLYL